MASGRLTPADQTLLQLASDRFAGRIADGPLANKLIEQHQMSLTRFWQHIYRLSSNPAARRDFPTVMVVVDARLAAGRNRPRSAA